MWVVVQMVQEYKCVTPRIVGPFSSEVDGAAFAFNAEMVGFEVIRVEKPIIAE